WDRGAAGPAGRVESDVSRSVADPARLFLRPRLSRARPFRRRKTLHAVRAGARLAARPDLPVLGDAGRADGGAPVRSRRRHAGGEARTNRIAWRGLQARERTLPLRPRVQRRKLEPSA